MSLMLPLLWTALLGPCAPAQPPPSYLYQPSYCNDGYLRLPAEPYHPQPGDLFLASEQSRILRIGHLLAGAGKMQHSGIVVARPDGGFALLEAGPNNTLSVRVLELIPQLRRYATHERVWIRRRCVPLTAEQSQQLTAFAMYQDGRRFALLRLMGQLTPFRSRGPLRTWVVGGPHYDRSSYFCAELVVEACVAAGLMDPATARPAATYPIDLFAPVSQNRYLARHLDLSQGWHPPARWTECPILLGPRDSGCLTPAAPARAARAAILPSLRAGTR